MTSKKKNTGITIKGKGDVLVDIGGDMVAGNKSSHIVLEENNHDENIQHEKSDRDTNIVQTIPALTAAFTALKTLISKLSF